MTREELKKVLDLNQENAKLVEAYNILEKYIEDNGKSTCSGIVKVWEVIICNKSRLGEVRELFYQWIAANTDAIEKFKTE